MSRVLMAALLILNERSNILTSTEIGEQQGRLPRPKPPHSTQKSEPPREKGGPLTCSPYKQSGSSSRSSPPGPAFSLQREYLTVVDQGGLLGGSWSGLLWLSYTSGGRQFKIRFLTSLPRRASWCLESRLMHHYGITPLAVASPNLALLTVNFAGWAWKIQANQEQVGIANAVLSSAKCHVAWIVPIALESILVLHMIDSMFSLCFIV